MCSVFFSMPDYLNMTTFLDVFISVFLAGGIPATPLGLFLLQQNRPNPEIITSSADSGADFMSLSKI